MSPDTTVSSYWLNWRVLVCAIILLAPLVVSAIIIWRYEGKRRDSPETLFQNEAWTTCYRRINPLWLLAFRVFSFITLLSLLIADIVLEGIGKLYFYTQWTFTLVTVYFGYASLLSIYGCYIYTKAGGDTESYTSIDDGDENLTKSPNTHSVTLLRQEAGFPVYIIQIFFQTCAGAVVLTDIVFWLIIFPFTPGYKLTFIDVCMHSLNFVFLFGDTCLNSLRFPLFRMSYFVLWSCIFVAYQWIFHVFRNLWWPYKFLDLSSQYAPLWYLGVALIHIPCFAVFALIIKLKSYLLQHHNS